jgi:hypothetical protein
MLPGKTACFTGGPDHAGGPGSIIGRHGHCSARQAACRPLPRCTAWSGIFTNEYVQDGSNNRENKDDDHPENLPPGRFTFGNNINQALEDEDNFDQPEYPPNQPHK